MAFIKKFCIFLPLDLGTTVISYLGILQGVVNAVVILTNFSSRMWPNGIKEPYNIDYIRVLLAIAQIVCSIQLVLSVKCQRSAFALPWLVVNLLELTDRLAFLMAVILSGRHIVQVDVREIALAVMFMLLTFEIWLYCWLCVFCFYWDLRKVIQKEEFDTCPIDLESIDTEMYLV